MRKPRWLHTILSFVGPRLAWLPAIVGLLACMQLLASAHWPFLHPAVAVNPKDEGYINAFAMRLRAGQELPYVDAVSHRGPMLYWLAAVFTRFGDPFTFVPLRSLALACSLLILVFVSSSALLARRPLAAALAPIGIVASLAVDMVPDDGIAYNGEIALDVFALASLALVTLALRLRPSRATLACLGGAGVLAALGALSKQVGGVTIVSLSLWPLAASLARTTRADGSIVRRCRPWLVFVGGAVLVFGIVIARYALAGQLRTLWFYLVTYNSKYYMAPYTAERALHDSRAWVVDHLLLVLGALGLALAGVVASFAGSREEGWLKRLDRRGFLFTVAASALVTAAVANGTLRNFPHYYVQVVPWFSLLLPLLAEEAIGLTETVPWRSALVQAAVLLPMLFVLRFAVSARNEEHERAQSGRKATLEVCKYVETHSNTDDRIFVWGFAADIYTYCRRAPASRYVYSTFLSGFVPFFDDPRSVEHARVVPGAADIFLGELDSSRAALVLDVPATLSGRSIAETPAYADYLSRKYCPPVMYDGVNVYERRLDDGTCPPP